MTHAALTDEDMDCLFGTLRRLLHDQRSGIMRSIAGEAGFDGACRWNDQWWYSAPTDSECC